MRIFGGKLEKKEDILDWEWGPISDPGDREKRPCYQCLSIDMGAKQHWQIQGVSSQERCRVSRKNDYPDIQMFLL